MVLCFASNEFIYQVQVPTLSSKPNITIMNVFILAFCIITMVMFICSHSSGLYLCPYCLAVNAEWIGSYIFINNVFLSWSFLANEFIYQGQVQTLSPKSNITACTMNVFILACCIITMVRFVCSHS